MKPKLQRNPYSYRRDLPHITKADWPHFITFRTWAWWILPPYARTIVLNAFLFHREKKYKLYSVVVMPEHVHAILSPKWDDKGDPLPLSAILHAIKGYTGHEIAKLLKRNTPVWYSEGLDHVNRREESLEEKLAYIRNNPVRRGLAKRPEEYEWFWEARG